jgi:UDP-N-acetylmuramoylalanine--D-glutamate ligase
MIQEWKNKHVTVMGLGRFGGGVGVTRWLARAGAKVLLTDTLPADKLAQSLEQLRDLEIKLRLGGHERADFCTADLVVVNPAVRDDSPFLQAARAAGVPLTTEINLFVERCPARCVGVTGSVGKSTIAAMIGHLLQKATPGSTGVPLVNHGNIGVPPVDPRGTAVPPVSGTGLSTARRVWVGGNIGRSLLDDLPAMRPDDVVVLELSSFQLQRTPLVGWSPQIAVITNVTANHLDWHGSFPAYLEAKLNVVRYQDPARDAIVIADVPKLMGHFDQLSGDLAGLWRYGLDGDDPVAVAQTTAAIECDDRRLRWRDVRLGVPGRHNRLNAAAALTVAHLLGVEASAAVAALATFEALPDRLQRVAVRDGVTYYNDSKSTTPEAAIIAMEAVPPPLLIILGGYDKGSDLRSVAETAARKAKFAAGIGQTGRKLIDMVQAAGGAGDLCGDLATAVAACRCRAEPGDTVLLSPACASWDQFDDYRARGQMFTRLVTADTGAGTGAASLLACGTNVPACGTGVWPVMPSAL